MKETSCACAATSFARVCPTIGKSRIPKSATNRPMPTPRELNRFIVLSSLGVPRVTQLLRSLYAFTVGTTGTRPGDPHQVARVGNVRQNNSAAESGRLLHFP